jgi:CBS domain-containing protein
VTDRIQLARHTPVQVCQSLLAIEPLLVGRDDDLLVTMRRAAAQPATRLIGILGDDGRIVGVLPILRLAEAVVARVVPESLLADISDIADVARFGHTLEARTVGDAMLPPATIRGEATVAEAFHLMHQRRLSGLYVVDADGRPTGYLDLLELAVNYVDALEAAEDHPDQAARKAALHPPDPPRDPR